MKNGKTSTLVELLLCVFLGWLGAHKFYAGKKGMGFLYLFTLGLCGIGWIIDSVLLILGFIKANAPANPNRELITENFQATGVNYYTENIGKLACRNDDWKLNTSQIISHGKQGKRIFRYNYINKPVKLVPEPNNEHDKNAVAVIIAGELVGYISRSENLHVLDVLNNREVKYISAFIGGGQYKIVDEAKQLHHFEDSIHVNIRIGYV